LLTPSGAITVIADTAFNRSIMINGGKSPYQAEILEAPLNNITLSQPVPFGPRIAIKGEPGMPVGDYTVYVADAAGHSTSLSLKVVAGGTDGAANNRNSAGGQGEDSDSPQASNCPAESEAPDAFELSLSVNAIKCIQAVIEIPESERDGVIGETTRKALCKYQDNSNMTPTGRITEILRDTLVKQFGQVLGEESDCQ
jgi:hypothetical protein